MIAHKYQYKNRQTPDTTTVVPATAEYAEQIRDLAAAAYDIEPALAEEWFSPAQYRSRMSHFPEGQTIALDTTHGRVVGMTSSMRFRFSPEVTFLEDWDRTTGYG